MSQNDCFNCKHDNICCSKFGVTLTKEEASKYDFKIVPMTENNLIIGHVIVLKKKENGECIYFKDKLCTIYENRPSACRKFSCIGRI